jgi:hypothetical protein
MDGRVAEDAIMKTLEVSRYIAVAVEFVLKKELLVDLEPMIWSINIFLLVDFEKT